VTTFNFSNCGQTKQMQVSSPMDFKIATEIGAVGHGFAALDQLPVDEILDRFTLALARQIARQDHDNALQAHFMGEGGRG
jgi:hypothetical protein